MIIRLVLLAVFFAWVVRAPLDYRTDLMAAAAKDNVELRLTNREADAQKAFLTGIKLPIGDKRRLRAISDLALVRWRQLKFKDAENLYRLAVIENKKSQSYDPVFVENMLNLGAV